MEKLSKTTETMKVKDLENFLRQFNPDSEVNFSVTMLSRKARFDLDVVSTGAVRKKGAPDAPVFLLDVAEAVKMSDDMVQLWKSKLAEVKVQE